MDLKDNPVDKPKSNLVVQVFIDDGESIKKEYYFNHTFRVGRANNCAVIINDGMVSRDHLEISFKDGEWWIIDLASTNGTYLEEKKIDRLKLTDSLKLQLGKNRTIISFNLVSKPGTEGLTHSEASGSLSNYIQRYFNAGIDNPNAGQHTRMIQQAFQVVKKKQSIKYYKIIIGILIIAVAAAVYSVYKHIKEVEYIAQAENIFYRMKDLELSIERIADSLGVSGELLKRLQESQREAEKEYDKHIKNLGLLKSDEKERLIQKIARKFGECEINIPDEFINEVKKYIKFWQITPEYKNAINRAKERNYIPVIAYNLNKRNLPVELFYLPLKESFFKEKSVGPATYMGYAKGIWHFIPSTAQQYGLKVGPLKDTNTYDPQDERFDFFKATSAAADYLKYIYSTDAQASGLLVMASYNWGEPRVIRYINQLTKNPKERNFWKLLSTFGDKVPEQTYDYVFYIFSAAVIGENPKLFEFDFENPLAEAKRELGIN